MLGQLYGSNLSLLTDLYQFTMANGYWKSGMYDREAVFYLSFREAPFNGDYTLAAGLGLVTEYLEKWHFDVQSIQYLGSLKGSDGKALFEEGFLNYLQRLEFSCDIAAIPEGTVVFPHQPLLRVKGPLIQAQLLETPLLNLINFSSLIATKAARICAVAKDPVLDFGLRRAQGIDGAITAARSAYIGGCGATSNVLAGKLLGIPVKGTHAHSWVMAFDDERSAFEAYAKAMPNNCVFLVDTYDSLEGVQLAIEVGKWLEENGHPFLGIRLDSGDLLNLSKQVRTTLDNAGFSDAKIFASNNLDEYRINELKEKGAPIAVWGVGTRLICAYDQPALGGVYKLSAIQDASGAWKRKVKRSDNPAKSSLPGMLQVRRSQGEDVQYDEWDTPELPEGEDLLQPVFQKGKKVMQLPSIHTIRERAILQWDQFSNSTEKYSYHLESTLAQRFKDMTQAK